MSENKNVAPPGSKVLSDNREPRANNKNLAGLKIFCVIPAWNEEKNIIRIINDIRPYASKIVVVDDGSDDRTFILAKSQNVAVLRHLINRGQGAALQTGNEYALRRHADIIVHFDADGQFEAKEIPDIIRPIKYEGYDIVFGSRFLNKKSKMPFLKEKLIMPIARLVNYLLIGKTSLTDPQNGFRAMTNRAARMIKIENDGAAHCSEIIYQTIKEKLKYTEAPVTVFYNNFGQSLWQGKGRGVGGLHIVKDLLFSKFID